MDNSQLVKPASQIQMYRHKLQLNSNQPSKSKGNHSRLRHNKSQHKEEGEDLLKMFHSNLLQHSNSSYSLTLNNKCEMVQQKSILLEMMKENGEKKRNMKIHRPCSHLDFVLYFKTTNR